MSTQFTVFLVDDDLDMRRLCTHLLSSVGVQVETYESGEQFLAAHPAGRDGVLLTDVRMPGMSGLDLIEALARQKTAMTMIVYSAYADVPMAVRALKAGAVEFLEKPFNQQSLIETIRHARAISHSASAERVKRGEVLARLAAISPREREVFALVVAGKPNKLVATDLGLSEKTIEIHRANLMRKMQAESFAHLVRMAVLAESELAESEAPVNLAAAR